MEAIFPKIALKIAILVFFKGLKSKSDYFYGFPKKFPTSIPTTSTLRVSQSKMNEHFSLQRKKIKEEMYLQLDF